MSRLVLIVAESTAKRRTRSRLTFLIAPCVRGRRWRIGYRRKSFFLLKSSAEQSRLEAMLARRDGEHDNIEGLFIRRSAGTKRREKTEPWWMSESIHINCFCPKQQGDELQPGRRCRPTHATRSRTLFFNPTRFCRTVRRQRSTSKNRPRSTIHFFLTFLTRSSRRTSSESGWTRRKRCSSPFANHTLLGPMPSEKPSSSAKQQKPTIFYFSINSRLIDLESDFLCLPHKRKTTPLSVFD